MIFDKNTFGQYHNVNMNTGFHPSVNKYDGYVRDAEGKPWGFIKNQNVYEQAETGIRIDPAEFQRRNIDILGYGSNDGGSQNNTVYDKTTNYTTGVDGIFELLSNGALDSAKDFDIVTNSTAYPVAGGVSPKLNVQFINLSQLRLQEGTSPLLSSISPAPPFIGLYVNGPSDDKGWYIAEHSGSGFYTYTRSTQGASFPNPITTTLTQPLAVTFYAADPGSVAKWTDYVT